MKTVDVSIIVAVVTLFSAPVAAAAGWAFSRKREKGDFSSSIAHASSDAVSAIQQVMKTLEKELADTQEDLRRFKDENDRLSRSLEELRKQNSVLIDQNLSLAAEIFELRRAIDAWKNRRVDES